MRSNELDFPARSPPLLLVRRRRTVDSKTAPLLARDSHNSTHRCTRPTSALAFSILLLPHEQPPSHLRRMVHLRQVCGSMAVLALSTAVHSQAANVMFKNQCEYSIDVYDNSNLCSVGPGSRASPTFGCGREIPGTTMYRHKKNPEATLAEFAYGSGKAWYDISIIPPGPDNCGSLDDCKKYTNKTGFNVPVMILPTKYLDASEFRCNRIMCQYDGCPDAFHYPKDNEKVYNCPQDEQFHVIYCP